MPRNGSGTMSVPHSFSAGNTISSPEMNTNFTDVGSEITNSLPRDGQAGMSGQFKATSGTEGAPGMAFGADTDTGFRRSAGDTMKVVTGADDLMEFGASGVVMETGKTFAADVMSAASLTLTTKLAIAQGGTGQATATAAFDALSPVTTRGDIIVRDASNNVRKAIGANLALLQSDGTDPQWVAPATALASLTADQAAMEAASSTAVWVPPGRQHFHPAMPKAWGLVTVSGGTPTLTTGYNIASVTDGGAGIFSPQFSNALSGTGYAVLATVFHATPGSQRCLTAIVTARLASGFTVQISEEGVTAGGAVNAIDNVSFSFMVLGDL